MSRSTIHQTSQAASWLEQFDPEDKEVARLLLQNLKLIDHELLARKLRNSCSLLAKSYPSDLFALFSVQKWSRGQAIFDAESGRFSGREPSGRGSEDIVDGLVAQIFNSNKSRFLKYPPLSKMKSARVRRVILLEDSIGSGQRVSNFLTSFLEHGTMKSWNSFNLLTFHIVVYAYNIQAWPRIIGGLPGHPERPRQQLPKQKIQIHPEVLLEPGKWQPFWPKKSRDAIEELCRKYGERQGLRHPLGYGEAMSNVIFTHTTPNNVPGIIWEETKSWKPILSRTPPRELLVCFRSGPTEPSLAGTLRALGVQSSEDSPLSWVNDPDLILVLCCIGKGVRNINKLSLRSGVSPQKVEDCLKRAMQFDFLDESGGLSTTGKAELKAVRKWFKKVERKYAREGNYPTYVPSSFSTGQSSDI